MFLNARNQGRKFQIEKHPKNKISKGYYRGNIVLN